MVKRLRYMTIDPDAWAPKQLSPYSCGPALGFDATLPQFRGNRSCEEVLRPEAINYPVRYFLYGVYARADALYEILDNMPELRPASVKGGRLRA